jgi:Flp pilus assembly pilin Flp
MLVRTFLNDNSGAVTLDWVVLTAALVGTGIAVMSTVSTGVDGLSSQTESELQGSIIRTSFVGNLCQGGLDAVQADENARVAAARANGIDTQAINVRRALNDLSQAKADEEVMQLYADMQATKFTPLEPETTEKSVLECEIQRRGLL